MSLKKEKEKWEFLNFEWIYGFMDFNVRGCEWERKYITKIFHNLLELGFERIILL